MEREPPARDFTPPQNTIPYAGEGATYYSTLATILYPPPSQMDPATLHTYSRSPRTYRYAASVQASQGASSRGAIEALYQSTLEYDAAERALSTSLHTLDGPRTYYTVPPYPTSSAQSSTPATVPYGYQASTTDQYPSHATVDSAGTAYQAYDSYSSYAVPGHSISEATEQSFVTGSDDILAPTEDSVRRDRAESSRRRKR